MKLILILNELFQKDGLSSLRKACSVLNDVLTTGCGRNKSRKRIWRTNLKEFCQIYCYLKVHFSVRGDYSINTNITLGDQRWLHIIFGGTGVIDWSIGQTWHIYFVLFLGLSLAHLFWKDMSQWSHLYSSVRKFNISVLFGTVLVSNFDYALPYKTFMPTSAWIRLTKATIYS